MRSAILLTPRRRKVHLFLVSGLSFFLFLSMSSWSSTPASLMIGHSTYQDPIGEQVHLFILVDDSASANASTKDSKGDPNGLLRSAALETILDFAVGYGWMTNNPPYLDVYKYSKVYNDPTTPADDDTLPVWPALGKLNYPTELFAKTVPTSFLLEDVLTGSLPNIQTIRSAKDNRVEDFTHTLIYLKGQIKSSESSGNNILIIFITQGGLTESGANSKLTELMQRSALVAKSIGYPIGIFIFDPTLKHAWDTNFIHEIDESANIYLHDCCDARNVWDAMITMYKANGYIEKGKGLGIVTGMLPANNKVVAFPAFSAPANLKILSLQVETESFKLNDTPGNSLINPNSHLRWWDLSLPADRSFDSDFVASRDVMFLYSYHLLPTANPPQVNETPIPPTGLKCDSILCPSFPAVFMAILIACISGFSVVCIPWVHWRLAPVGADGHKKAREPLHFAIHLLFVSDITMLTLIGYLASRGSAEKLLNIVMTSLVTWIMFSGGSTIIGGVLIKLINTPPNVDEHPGQNPVLLLAITFAGFILFFSTLLLIF
jgi:hypothetical protein